jgi:hypothetical protein
VQFVSGFGADKLAVRATEIKCVGSMVAVKEPITEGGAFTPLRFLRTDHTPRGPRYGTNPLHVTSKAEPRQGQGLVPDLHEGSNAS